MGHDRVVVITGASSGIGEALAHEYAKRGARTVLLARRVERIAAIAKELGADRGRSLAIACDVTVDGEIESAIARAQSEFGRVDVVIANAGFGVDGFLERLSVDDYRRQFETNVFGVIRTAKAAIPSLTDARGVLAVVGSVSGYVVQPGASAYSMSKFAVRALCDGVRAELGPKGVAVTHIAPGFVVSDIRRTDRKGNVHEGHDDPVPLWLQMPTAKAARLIADAIDRRAPELVLTGHGRFGVFMARHAPAIVRGVMGLVARRGQLVKRPGG
jgi:NADP-dependent 3-hydroxy acid dehydrogenase YdfG